MAHLVIETQDGVRRVALDRERYSIGRLAYNDIVLPFAQISRQHAEIVRRAGQWWIADLHSTNGLHFNDRRIQERALQNGDAVLLAPGITLRFIASDLALQGADAQPTDAAGPEWPAGTPRPPAAKTQPVRLNVPSSPVKQRSPFDDGEVPYVPTGMASSQPSTPSSSPAPRHRMPPARGTIARPSAPPPRDPPPPGGPTAPSGYPAPAGPLVGGGDGDDPYRRGAPAAGHATTGGPAKALYVCQTCGQRTAADAVLCQNCHQPIASECPVCGLNLLPALDRCPRCQTVNAAYVGRARPGRSSA